MRYYKVHPIGHPIFFKPYQLSHIDDEANHSSSGYIAFPEGNFTNLAQVKEAEGVLFEEMKAQYLQDIDRLRSLSRVLVGDIYNSDINGFYEKIRGGLTGRINKFSSMIAFRDTRYQLHRLVNRIGSFLHSEGHSTQNGAPVTRDGLCCLLHECLAGINYCIEGSSSRIRSAFISLESVEGGVQARLYKIRHDLLEYAVKAFLAKEFNDTKFNYRLGNGIHWGNALYNLACNQFGLEPIVDSAAEQANDLALTERFECTLPSLMPEREIFNRLTDDLYQELVFCLKKLNREEWLTRPVAASELDYETTNEIDHDFLTPVNLQCQLDENNRLTLWTIIQQNDDGTFDLSNSRERFQVWLLNTMLTPETRVFATVADGRSSHLRIGSMDNLYFWVFASDSRHRQGDTCLFDWGNHQTLTMAHLRKIDFHTWPEEVCLNLLHHALKHTRTFDDFCQFFLDQTALAEWQTTREKHPQLADMLTEQLSISMLDSQRFVQGLTRCLDSFSDDKQKFAQPFLPELFRLALRREQFNVVACFCESGFDKLLTKKDAVNFDQVMRAALVAGDSGRFKILLKHALANPCYLWNQKNGSLIGSAARHGQTECLDMLLSIPGMVAAALGNSQTPVMEAAHGHEQCLRMLLGFDNSTVNKQNKKGWSALMVAASEGHTECLRLLLAQKRIKVHLKNKEGDSALMLATRNGHGDCVAALLEHDSKYINQQNNDGYTALMLAALSGDERCATLLFQQPDLDINLENRKRETAFELVSAENKSRQPWQSFGITVKAAKDGDVRLLTEQLKLNRGLINLRNEKGSSLLMLAAKRGHLPCLELLLRQKGIMPDRSRTDGVTAMMIAAYYGKTDCLKALLAHGNVDINKKRLGDGYTALVYAARFGHVHCLRLLLAQKGIQVNLQQTDGYTAVMKTVEHGHAECLRLLLAHKGTKHDIPDKGGWTPLMLAARCGHLDCLEQLLECSTKTLNKQSNDGLTALMMAALGDDGDGRCASLLLKQPEIDVNIKRVIAVTRPSRTALEMVGASKLQRRPWSAFQEVLEAAKNGNVDLLTELIGCYPSLIHVRDEGGFTPLLLAIKNGHVNCLVLLMREAERSKTPATGGVAGADSRLRGKGGLFAAAAALKVWGTKSEQPTNTNNLKSWLPLIIAAQHGRADCLRVLLASGNVDVNVKREDGCTALMMAARHGYIKCLEILLAQKGIKVNQQHTDHNATAIMLAAKHGHVQCLKALLARTRDRYDGDGSTALMLAAKYGHADCVSALLDHDAKLINARNKEGYTALMFAAKDGHKQCAEVLLQHPGIDINEKNPEGKTAVELVSKGQLTQPPWKFCVQILNAAERGDLEELAEHLKFSRALLRVSDRNGFTPLMLAVSKGQINCVELLLSYKGGEPDQQSKWGWTAQMLAARHGHVDCLKALLATGNVDVNKRHKGGFSSLMLVVCNGHAKCLEILLAHKGINVHQRCSVGKSAVMLAAQCGHPQCLRLLLAFDNSQVNAQSNGHWTALMLAARSGNIQCLQLLLAQKSIKAYRTNKEGWTALMLAASNGHVDCVKVLLDYDVQIINLQDDDGFNALILATLGGHERCLELLLRQPNIQTNLTLSNGQTASELAAANRHWRCKRLLVEHRTRPAIA